MENFTTYFETDKAVGYTISTEQMLRADGSLPGGQRNVSEFRVFDSISPRGLMRLITLQKLGEH